MLVRPWYHRIAYLHPQLIFNIPSHTLHAPHHKPTDVKPTPNATLTTAALPTGKFPSHVSKQTQYHDEKRTKSVRRQENPQSNPTPMHQHPSAPELHALAPHEHLQRAVQRLLAVALPLDEFAAEGGQGGSVADG